MGRVPLLSYTVLRCRPKPPIRPARLSTMADLHAAGVKLFADRTSDARPAPSGSSQAPPCLCRGSAHLKHEPDKDDGAKGGDDVSVVSDEELHAEHGRTTGLDTLAA